MENQNQTLQLLTELKRGQDELRSGQDELLAGLGRTDGRVSRIEIAVVSLQSTTSDLDGRLAHLEDVADKTYSKLDGFMILINRHEAELASLRSAIDRITERLTRLEGHAMA